MGTLSKTKKRAATKPAAENNSKALIAAIEKTGKTKKAKVESKVDKANAENIAKKITNKKDLKYKYPKDCDTLDLRKKFRATARRQVNSLEKTIARLLQSNLPEDMELLATKEAELAKVEQKIYATKAI